MAKLTLSDLANLQNEQTAVSVINANNTLIETALENTLSRDGATPNTMNADLDMNSNNILNLPEPASDTEPARKIDLEELQASVDQESLTAAVAAAEAAQTAAEAAQVAAELAETNAETAEANAETAEANAETAETNAETAATTATTQAGIATAQAVIAANNATVVAGDKYTFEASTVMGEPAVGGFRFNHAAPASATAIAVNAQNALVGNPDTSAWVASWDDSSNPTNKANLLIRELGTPSNGIKYYITGVTDNSTWLQLDVSGGTNLGTPAWTAGDEASFQVGIIGDAGAMSGPATSTDHAVARYDGTGGSTVQDSGVIIDDSNNVTGVSTLDIGNADTTISRSAAGVIAVEGVDVSLNSTSAVHTAGTIELGHASDTTISRSASGLLAVEGVDLAPQILQTSLSAATTLTIAHANRHILHPTSDNNARTFTIPANASVAYPIGTTLTFINQINTVTIAITSDTLTLSPAGTTGSRTLAANGMATAIKIGATNWMISGTGLT